MELKSPSDIQKYQDVDSTFVDYTRFEDTIARRQAENAAFINDEVYVPGYEYPRLDTLYDATIKKDVETYLSEKKRDIYEAILELEAAKSTGVSSEAELALWADFHEVRLKKIMLVETARRLHHSADSSAQFIAREEFVNLNKELYGGFDSKTFAGMMTSEREIFSNFSPQNQKATEIKEHLSAYYETHELGLEREEPLLDKVLLGKLKTYIEHKYKNILSFVPNTGDEVIYNAQECQRIMEAALEAGGLVEQGWIVVVDAKKSNPATSAAARKISLPRNTQRTAAELRRLIVHEQEVHARRGENGAAHNTKLLRDGTAAYADVEEGLGVLLECAIDGSMDNPSYHRARDRYIVAGLALGADGTPRDARATYETVWRLIALRDAKNGVIDEGIEQDAKKRAMAHVENAFRGTDMVALGVIYTKLKVYFEGLVKNARFFKGHEDNLDEAFESAMLGKYDHTDTIERQNINNLLGLVA